MTTPQAPPPPDINLPHQLVPGARPRVTARRNVLRYVGVTAAAGGLAASVPVDPGMDGSAQAFAPVANSSPLRETPIATSANVSLRETLRRIEAQNAAIEKKLDILTENLTALTRMTARHPDGRTLINLVSTILQKVER